MKVVRTLVGFSRSGRDKKPICITLEIKVKNLLNKTLAVLSMLACL